MVVFIRWDKYNTLCQVMQAPSVLIKKHNFVVAYTYINLNIRDSKVSQSNSCNKLLKIRVKLYNSIHIFFIKFHNFINCNRWVIRYSE